MPGKLKPPLPPMEAQSVADIPVGDEWVYEPKWDGFRCLAFRDGDSVKLQSKSGQPLARYFPEVVATLRSLKSDRFVLDGELVVPVGRTFSFDALLQRIHPAESRVKKLSVETPATFIVFDLLADDDEPNLLARPLSQRRRRLEAFARKHFAKRSDLQLSPSTSDLKIAQGWFRKVGGNLDGIVAKRADLPYRSGERDGMRKIKQIRTADCVVGGFRYSAGKKVVGSLLLGLYDDQGLLHHVGFSASFTAAERKQWTKELEPLVGPSGFTGSAPGKPSRWSTKRSAEWRPLKLKLVVEVEYDHFTGGRFRHGTNVLRRRHDKSPRQCTLDQVTGAEGQALQLLKPTRRARATARK